MLRGAAGVGHKSALVLLRTGAAPLNAISPNFAAAPERPRTAEDPQWLEIGGRHALFVLAVVVTVRG